MSVVPETLARLWALAGGQPEDASCDWNVTFDPVGLILYAPPRRAEYWCTPENSVTFATTGGDGVHYGLLAVEGAISDFSPVVMTVPMSDTPNVVVGANLREFLSLGCRFGYFALEQLVYAPEETIAELEAKRFDPDATDVERALLRRLSEAFNLSPWATPGTRLHALATAFASKLILPPFQEHAP